MDVLLDLYLERITELEQTYPTPMSEDRMCKVYALSAAVERPCDVVRENDALPDNQIFRPLAGFAREEQPARP